MTSQTQAHKPSSIEVIRILDDALPKIKAFQSLSYTQANRIVQDDYFAEQWKEKKRKFGSLYCNLDYKNRDRILRKIGIELSEPNKIMVGKNIEHTMEWHNSMAYQKWDFQRHESAIVFNFCLYALNHSSYKGFTQDFINVKGWIKAWKMMSSNMKIEFSNMLIDYV
jgi:hypothetical protein